MSQHTDPAFAPLPGERVVHIGYFMLCDLRREPTWRFVTVREARQLYAYGVLGSEVDCLPCCAALRGMMAR